MKLLLSTHGIVSVKISQEDVVPLAGLLQRDLIQFIGNLYNFDVKPHIPANIPQQAMLPILTFNQGRFESGGQSHPVIQLIAFQNGDAVMASDTEIAERILTHYLDDLDSGLGFRNKTVSQTRYYVSNIIVEFDYDIAARLEGINIISELLNKEISRSDAPFSVKRLALGSGDPVPLVFAAAEATSHADFTLERRAGQPYSSNRYFSSAPTRTEDHIRILESIEKLLR